MVMSLMQQAEELARRNQFNPFTQAYDEANGVAGRVAQITSQQSPLMKLAATRADQQMAQRGLRKSTLGIQAGQDAVIGAATPIATADAQMFNQQRLVNQDAINAVGRENAARAASMGMEGMRMDADESQFARTFGENARQFNAGQGLTREQMALQDTQFGRQLGENTRQFDVDQAAKESQFARTQAQQITLAQMDVASRKELAQIEAQFKTQIQGDLNISNAWGTTQEQISKIQNNPDLDENAKRTLIQNTMDSFKSFTTFWSNLTGGTTDVSALLNFSAASPAATPPAAPAPAAYSAGAYGGGDPSTMYPSGG